MPVIERTFTSLSANLAFDDRLLEDAESRESSTLRFWEAPAHGIVLGRSSRESGLRIPAERRSTGGGAVLVGPGCLCYTLALPLSRYPGLRDVRDSYCSILGSIGASLALAGVTVAGTSDLAWNGRKFSGNSQRRTRGGILHHGTVLYRFDLGRISDELPEPARQPDYRAGRSHAEFLANLPLARAAIQSAIEAAFGSGFTGPTCALT